MQVRPLTMEVGNIFNMQNRDARYNGTSIAIELR